jgi:hypothetical protein
MGVVFFQEEGHACPPAAVKRAARCPIFGHPSMPSLDDGISSATAGWFVNNTTGVAR